MAWSVGPPAHPGQSEADDRAGHDHASVASAIDPVCGMTVDRERATAAGLHLQHEDVDYFFGGRGCKLELGDDPGRFLSPGYVPSM